ncbi:hypothetical protein QBC37DRAFT_379901 [Rhypophila decipiens]|uniref:Peptidase C14 caspase domain-containing protein n=1 Tax=Rhypophila decipiens TaxID=261697 RepID=A0AAN7B488_9PEZI|nr:hypothetical protein QBC37DRAFT_379901 [Rhypophila decipiens]
MASWQGNQTPYKTASLMCAYWAQNGPPGVQPGVDRARDEIEGVLGSTYGFQTERYIMKDKTDTDPGTTTADIINSINQKLGNKGSDHLFVLHYCGHGVRTGGPDSDLMWGSGITPTNSANKTRINYSDIHRELLALKCDVLVVMDCCRSTDIGRTPPQTGATIPKGKKMIFVGATSSNASEATATKPDNLMTTRLCTSIKSVNGHPASLWAVLGECNAVTSAMRTELNGNRKTAHDSRRANYDEAGYVYWEDSRAKKQFLVQFVCVDVQPKAEKGKQEADMFLHKIGSGGGGGGTSSRGLGGPSGGATSRGLGGPTSRGFGGEDRGFGLDDNMKGRKGKGNGNGNGKRRPIWRRVCCFCLPCK